MSPRTESSRNSHPTHTDRNRPAAPAEWGAGDGGVPRSRGHVGGQGCARCPDGGDGLGVSADASVYTPKAGVGVRGQSSYTRGQGTLCRPGCVGAMPAWVCPSVCPSVSPPWVSGERQVCKHPIGPPTPAGSHWPCWCHGRLPRPQLPAPTPSCQEPTLSSALEAVGSGQTLLPLLPTPTVPGLKPPTPPGVTFKETQVRGGW